MTAAAEHGDTVTEVLLLLGLTATALSLVRGVPQSWRTLRHGRTAGLSVASLALNALSCGLWLTYAAIRLDLPLLLCNAVQVLLGIAVLHATVRHTPTGRTWQAAVAAVAAMAVAAALVAPATTATVCAIAAVVVGPVRNLPQAWALRHRTDATGVSAATWALTVAAHLTWTLYGLLSQQLAVTLASGLSLASAIAVVALLRRSQQTAQHTTHPRPTPPVAPAATQPA